VRARRAGVRATCGIAADGALTRRYGRRVAGRRPEELELRTRLARLRVQRRISQTWLAQATGISPRTLQRLEAGHIDNPPLRYLVNCAMALGVGLDEVIEDEWREWKAFEVRFAGAPPPDEWWNDRDLAPDEEWLRSPYANPRRGDESGD
jgi:transcriptional regulator with XRE-family HTH domain